jgi:hypothetical protein
VWSKFNHITWGLGIIYKVKISALCGVISISLSVPAWLQPDIAYTIKLQKIKKLKK